MSQPVHPGHYIRDAVIPKGLSQKRAAELLGISRPALSNLLTGAAALTPEMAEKLERAFGADAATLLDQQAKFDAASFRGEATVAQTRTYVPAFLQIKASHVEQWADTIAARTRLPVLVRILVASTGFGLMRTDFPGNDSGETHGWDGWVETEQAGPWIPLGMSGWEMGTSTDPAKKAEHDFARRSAVLGADAKTVTFVFVTPRRWKNKQSWIAEKRLQGTWRDVRAYDADDIEQWLEQSLSAQAWFAEEIGMPRQGVTSLEACWTKWVADCTPPLSETLFEPAVNDAVNAACKWIKRDPGEPFTVGADSLTEALAFLRVLFSKVDELAPHRDKVAAFEKTGVLPGLAVKSADFIPVIVSDEIEREFAPYRNTLRAIVVRPRNSMTTEPDATLDTLGYEDFAKGLKAMRLDDDAIAALSRESGRSLTVLRRRLSEMEGVRTPTWAQSEKFSRALIPIALAGTWGTKNKADQAVLTSLAHDRPYTEIERDLAELMTIDDVPVWWIGTVCGVTSKIDSFFAIRQRIVPDDIERFLKVAEKVLGEDDPSLDLPEAERWAKSIHGKTREISEVLRLGISETLVLLAVHGESLFGSRIPQISKRIAALVKRLLTPLDARKLEAQSEELRVYAEAAPQTLLDILEKDLEGVDPETFKLLRPADASLLGGCPRSGLLWALEVLAWFKDQFMSTVLVLGRLAQVEVDDNWSNKPMETLQSIFRGWWPQTSVSVELRIAALDQLIKRYPGTGWQLCLEEFRVHSQFGSQNAMPRWRTDARGHREAVRTVAELRAFAVPAIDRCLEWGRYSKKRYSKEQLGDLLDNLDGLNRFGDEYREKVWQILEAWRKSGVSEEDKAWLREKIRTTAFSRTAVIRGRQKNKKHVDHARKAYDALRPADSVLEFEWLFRDSWVDESADELNNDDFDFEAREQRVAAQRETALRTILAKEGNAGVVRLAKLGNAQFTIGGFLPSLIEDDDQVLDLVILAYAQDQAEPIGRRMTALVSGLVCGLDHARWSILIPLLKDQLAPTDMVRLLQWSQFDNRTWSVVKTLRPVQQRTYWNEVHPQFFRRDLVMRDVNAAIEKLIRVGRPRAAFRAIDILVKDISPKLLFRLLDAMSPSEKKKEPSGFYRVDGYRVSEAFKSLNDSGEIASDEMARLEFRYIDILTSTDYGIPNLEKQISSTPALFIQAVATLYKRVDGKDDPPELEETDQDKKESMASAAWKFLHELRRVPGEDGKTLTRWVRDVQEGCSQLGRRESGDYCIGELLSRSPVGTDNLWPNEAVRDALEEAITEKMASGFRTGRYNNRGVTTREVFSGGGLERSEADQYRIWSDALQLTHPRVSKALRMMAVEYVNEAEWHDNDAAIRRRLTY